MKYAITILLLLFLLVACQDVFEAYEGRMSVVVTPEGEKYHVGNCMTLHRSDELIVMTISEAEEEGYTPCLVCIRREVNRWKNE